MKIAWLPYLVLLLALVVSSPAALAEPGKPLAIRWWGQSMVSIETYWNLQVVIDPFAPNSGSDDPKLSADLVLLTHEPSDDDREQLIRGQPVVVHGLADGKQVLPLRQVLDRLPNEKQPTWRPVEANQLRSGHEITVTTVPAWHDDEVGRDRGRVAMIVIDVDGVRIVHCGDLGQSKLRPDQLAALGRVDVLLLPVGGNSVLDVQTAAVVEQVKPRYAVPIQYKTPVLRLDLHGVEPFVEAVKNRYKVERLEHNTLAVSAAKPAGDAPTQIVVILNHEPWQPEGELAVLIERMETACRDSQAVFSPLSAEQMNFRPANGSHTPRWNAEHMMGRELQFFTEIFHVRDPSIAVIDLNPAQMPPDYKPAHPDWTGAEEARQMERTSALVRRFAYLLDDIDLDQPAPNSRWTLRRLLAQMERHYGEHTANVQKKFELEDWPEP